MLAVVLTLIVPGLGHLYYGFNVKAFALIGVFLLSGIFPVLLVVLYPYALYDVWKIHSEDYQPKIGRSEAVLVVCIGFIGPVLFGALLFLVFPPLLSYLQNEYSHPNRVVSEGNKISRALEAYYQTHGHYPEKLAVLMKGNPLRKRWSSDPWGQPYYYAISESQESYILLSLGPDGKRDTADDLVIHSP